MEDFEGHSSGMRPVNFHHENGRFICDDCGTEVRPEWGKQCRNPAEPILVTERAYVMRCQTCKRPKGEWVAPDERDADLREMARAS